MYIPPLFYFNITTPTTTTPPHYHLCIYLSIMVDCCVMPSKYIIEPQTLLLTLVYNASKICIILSSVSSSSSSIFSPNIDVCNGGYRRNTSNMILSLGDSVRCCSCCCCCCCGGDNKTSFESILSSYFFICHQ